MTSRIVFSIARSGDLPQVLARTMPGRRTPWAATILVFLIALSMLPLRNVGTVASMSSFASLLAFCSVNAAVIALRLRLPTRDRPFRIPGNIGNVPVVSVLGLLCSAGLLSQFASGIFLLGAVAVVLILGLYWFRAMRSNRIEAQR